MVAASHALADSATPPPLNGTGTVSDPGSAEKLIGLLNAEDKLAVQGAVKALGELKDPRAVEPLCALLKDYGREVACRNYAPNALMKIGDKRAVPALVAAMKDQDCDVRRCSQAALAGLGWVPATDAERACAAVARGSWDEAIKFGAASVEPLLAALRTCSPQGVRVLAAAADALAKVGWAPASDSERAMLAVARRDMDAAVKFGAAAVEPLLRLYGCGDLQAMQAIEKIGPAAVDPLAEILRRRDATLGPMAAQFLCVTHNLRAVEPLIAVLRDESALPQTVRLAAFALGQLRDPRAIEPLKALKSHRSAACRQEAQAALQSWNDAVAVGAGSSAVPAGGNKQARQSLLASLKLQDPQRRLAAARGLGRMRDKTTVAPLIEVLKDSDSGVRAAAAAALGAIGDPQALEALKAAQQDPDAAVRNAATEALKTIPPRP
jgi:HEAT repeat protein